MSKIDNILNRDGVYLNMPEATYHADCCPEPSLSSGLVKVLINKTPAHAWYAHPKLNPQYQSSDSKSFDLGKAAHSLMLNDPRVFKIIDAEDFRTNAAKEARDAAYLAGKTPILKKQYPEIEKMVEAGRKQIAESEGFSTAFVDGKSEVTLAWQEDNGVWCRIRIDHIAKNVVDFYDYKTTGADANPSELQNYGLNLGWHITSAFYKRGIKKVLGVHYPAYMFIVQENYAPYCVSALFMNAEAEARATKLIEKAIAQWGECLKSNKFPGYPNKPVPLDLPSYYKYKLDEAEALEEAIKLGETL